VNPSPEDVAARLADLGGAAWLDGGAGAEGWSILAWSPVEVVTEAAAWPTAGRALSRGTADASVPFSGGCLGYIGYEAAAAVDAFPAARATAEPPVWLGRYEGGLCFRHADRSWHIAGSASFRRDATRILDGVTPLGPVPAAGPTVVRTVDRGVHEERVRKILALIADGDCYQVNLTRPVEVDGATDPWAAYRRLRRLAGASYAAWLRLGPELAILSSSPELFLAVEGRGVSSIPIKGTRPRNPDPVVDHALRDTLRTSEKDKAELTMIVDLVRNDLGRIAVPGSVVAEPRRLTAHANVHHAAQRVSAVLADGEDAWSALAATFPPGSVTGAPKIRACQRIAELEASPRGVYCGAIGYVSASGIARWNVAIRTAVWTPGRVRYHVGGGIVADSDPAEEWDETVAKGTLMARAFAGHAHEKAGERPEIQRVNPLR
jgi:para-aminobenzoate synthetase component 1